jgi:hypothetical protein
MLAAQMRKAEVEVWACPPAPRLRRTSKTQDPPELSGSSMNNSVNLFSQFLSCHSRASGNPEVSPFPDQARCRVPAFAGMTLSGGFNKES